MRVVVGLKLIRGGRPATDNSIFLRKGEMNTALRDFPEYKYLFFGLKGKFQKSLQK